MANWLVQLKIGKRNKLEEDLTTYIVDRVKKARDDSGYSQRELSKLLGRSDAYISQIEGGRLDLSVVDFIGISLLLNKPLKYFLLPFNKEEAVTFEGDLGNLTSQEWELLNHFREIDNADTKETAVDIIAKLGEKGNKPKRKKQS